MSNNTKLHEILQKILATRESNSARRKLTIAAPNSVDFSSNDFLSLSRSPLLRKEFTAQLEKVKHLPLGSGGSRLLDGNSEYIEKLENDIADFHRADAGLLFNSGFDANAALFSCVPQPGDVILYDEYIHASVHEGMRLSRASSCHAFAHNSLEDFSRLLKHLLQSKAGLKDGTANLFVAIETVYSMDGDLAPISNILELLSQSLPKGNGHVIVDEAHSTGIYGEHGRGLVCDLVVEKRIFARLHTFGKALSSGGAIVLCSKGLRDYLVNYARSLIYTTAPGLPTLAMINSSYSLMRKGATVQAQKSLWHLINYFHQRTKALPSSLGIEVSPSPPRSPIFSLQIATPRELAHVCQQEGLIVRPIVHPTVPKGSERVRVCLHAANTSKEIDRLIDVVGTFLNNNERTRCAKRSASTPHL